MESIKSESRIARKKKTKTVRRTPIKILWSMVMVLSTTIRQNLFVLARFCPGRYNDDGNGDGANETLFIDAIVVESVAPVVIVLRRPNTLKRKSTNVEISCFQKSMLRQFRVFLPSLKSL